MGIESPDKLRGLDEPSPLAMEHIKNGGDAILARYLIGQLRADPRDEGFLAEIIKRIRQTTPSHVAPIHPLVEAVRWILQDAAYKAPEQIGVVAERWIDRLRDAMTQEGKPVSVPSTTRQIDPWALYVEAFRAMFPGHSPIELSATALQEMVDRLKTTPSATPRIQGLDFIAPHEGVRKVGLVFKTQEAADAFKASVQGERHG